MSGADIKTAINEAAIAAITNNEELNNEYILIHLRRIEDKDLCKYEYV